MPRKAPISDGNGRLLRPHQTPLRRSPRFLPRENDDVIDTHKPISRKKPIRHSPKKTTNPHLRSSPSSADPQKIPSFNKIQSKKKSFRSSGQNDASWSRSPRFVSNSSEIASGKKTQNRHQVESCKKRLRSVDSSQPQRRSQRVASILLHSSKKGVSLDETSQQGRGDVQLTNKSRGRPKAVGKSEASVNRVDIGKIDMKSIGRKKSGCLTKRRKIDAKCEGTMETERIEAVESFELLGLMVDHRKSCEEMDAIGRTEEECCGLVGWTEDQEAALRRAYLGARPSPHFWKKVSKLVPGKTAQECFDKIHANFATPPQPRPRSKTSRMNLSPISNFSLSGSKSTEFTIPRIKRLKSSKKKSLVALKTARHLLQKHWKTDQNQEADYFSILETSPNALVLDLPDIRTPASANHLMGPSFIQKFGEKTSSAHKSLLSVSKLPARLKDASPEVLKQIKDMALHEKYIDKLHLREARRRTVAKCKSSAVSRDYTSSGELKTSVKAAKTALMSEVRDVFSHFQQIQSNTWDKLEDFDTDDDYVDSDDDSNTDGNYK